MQKKTSSYYILFVLAIILFFTGCKIYKPNYFFREIVKDTVLNNLIKNENELKIQKGDGLAIAIFSLSAEEDNLFNKSLLSPDGKSGFQVNAEGYIYFHKLGKIQVDGLTRKELKMKLEKELLPYLKDPIVTVSFSNHHVTIIAEGGSKVIDMADEKITILDAIASSPNSFNINSQLNNVLVIRESQRSKQIKNINLEDPSIFYSPWYYLQPNDVVVVKPNEQKIYYEQKRVRNQLLFSTVITTLSFLLFIAERIFR